MASIRREIEIGVPASVVWEAICDFGAAHTRLFPGILTDVRLDGDARIATFANGLVVREDIVDVDGEAMRFAYSASGGRSTHHNASFQVFANGDGSSRVVWITDLLPHDAAPQVTALMEMGIATMKRALEQA